MQCGRLISSCHEGAFQGHMQGDRQPPSTWVVVIGLTSHYPPVGLHGILTGRQSGNAMYWYRRHRLKGIAHESSFRDAHLHHIACYSLFGSQVIMPYQLNEITDFTITAVPHDNGRLPRLPFRLPSCEESFMKTSKPSDCCQDATGPNVDVQSCWAETESNFTWDRKSSFVW